MKKNKIFAFTLCAAVILSGCNAGTPASEVSESETTTSATETTKTGEPTTEATTPVTTTEVAKEEVKLEWGMSAEQVRSAETYEFAGEDTAEIDGSKHTLLRYKKVPFMEHNTQKTVYIDSEKGLDRISYKFVSDDMGGLIDELIESTRKEYGHEVINGYTDVWHSEEKHITATLLESDLYAVFSVMPLMSEEERNSLSDFLMSGGEIDENGSRVELLIDMNWTNYTAEGIECDPIDKSLDCEKILLEKADEIQKLFNGFIRFTGGDAYELGEPERVQGFPTHLGAAPVISDEIKTIADIKSRLNEAIYDKYTDYLMQQQYGEANGKLYRLGGERGSWLGVNETWYIGFDVTDDKIIGHFAVLGWGDDDDYGVKNPDHLNDINSYEFYDITVQNIGGKYVVTDVRGTTRGDGTAIPYDYFECHGCYYNYNEADRSLITNEAVKPKQGEAVSVSNLLFTAQVNFPYSKYKWHLYYLFFFNDGSVYSMDYCIESENGYDYAFVKKLYSADNSCWSHANNIKFIGTLSDREKSNLYSYISGIYPGSSSYRRDPDESTPEVMETTDYTFYGYVPFEDKISPFWIQSKGEQLGTSYKTNDPQALAALELVNNSKIFAEWINTLNYMCNDDLS